MQTKKESSAYFNKKINLLIVFLLILFLIKLIILWIPQGTPFQKQSLSAKNQEEPKSNSLANSSASSQSTFEGFLPCIDCDGILTQITIAYSPGSLECFLKEEYQNIQEAEEQNQIFEERVPCEIIERQEDQKEKKILRLNPQAKEDLREFLFLDEETLLETTPNQLIFETEEENYMKEEENHTKEENSYILKKISSDR